MNGFVAQCFGEIFQHFFGFHTVEHLLRTLSFSCSIFFFGFCFFYGFGSILHSFDRLFSGLNSFFLLFFGCRRNLFGLFFCYRFNEWLSRFFCGLVFFFGIGDRSFFTYVFIVCFWQIVVGFFQHSHDLNQFEYTIYSIPLKKNHIFHKCQEASACATNIFSPFPTLAPAFLPAFIKAVSVGL